jgi:hypothetical protein
MLMDASMAIFLPGRARKQRNNRTHRDEVVCDNNDMNIFEFATATKRPKQVERDKGKNTQFSNR